MLPACRRISAASTYRLNPNPTAAASTTACDSCPRAIRPGGGWTGLCSFLRIPGGRGIERVTIDGNEHRQFTRDSIVLAGPKRPIAMRVVVQAGEW